MLITMDGDDRYGIISKIRSIPTGNHQVAIPLHGLKILWKSSWLSWTTFSSLMTGVGFGNNPQSKILQWGMLPKTMYKHASFSIWIFHGYSAIIIILETAISPAYQNLHTNRSHHKSNFPIIDFPFIEQSLRKGFIFIKNCPLTFSPFSPYSSEKCWNHRHHHQIEILKMIIYSSHSQSAMSMYKSRSCALYSQT